MKIKFKNFKTKVEKISYKKLIKVWRKKIRKFVGEKSANLRKFKMPQIFTKN